MIQKTKKTISVLLSLLMVLSVFGGMAFNASAADPHTHAFTYTADGNTITATCSVDGCDLPDSKITLTITDPENKYYDDNESSHHFTLEGLDAFNSATGKAISVDNLVYYKGDNQSSDIKNNRVKGATYKAKLTVEGKTAEHSFTFTAKPKPHIHSFIYSASGAVITATCVGTDGTCDLLNKQATLTLNAPAHKRYDDGLNANATFTGEIPGVTAPTINYRKSDTPLSAAPTDAGTYTAWCQLGNATAKVEYTIAQATNPGFTKLPQAITGLVYTGQPQTLITAGETSTGQIAYTAGTDSEHEPDVNAGGMPYTYSVPTMINAGTYYVWCKLDGGKNYTSLAAQKIEVEIAKANSVVVTVPSANTLTYSGYAQELVVAGEATGGEMQYALGMDDAAAPAVGWSASIPTETETGTYYVWYKVVGDSNHNDVGPAVLTSKIVADMTALQAKIDEATDYYNSITEDYPAIAETLNTAISEAQAVTNENQSTVNAAVTALDDAIKAAKEAKTFADEAAADQAAADAVEEKIDAIGEVEYTDESKTLIDDARAAYDALTDEQKELVDNAEALTAAEARYAELKAAAETPTNPTPEEPTSGGSGCPVCGAEEHEIEWIGILHQVFYALKYLFNNVLYPIYKAIK